MADVVTSLTAKFSEILKLSTAEAAADEVDAQSEASSVVYLLKYLDVEPTISPTAPIGWPHLVDLDGHDAENCESSNMHMPDAVITILCNYDKQALHAFLDEINYHHFGYEFRNPDGLSVAITRRGSYVVCGFFKPHFSSMQIEWHDHFVFQMGASTNKPWNLVRYDHTGLSTNLNMTSPPVDDKDKEQHAFESWLCDGDGKKKLQAEVAMDWLEGRYWDTTDANAKAKVGCFYS